MNKKETPRLLLEQEPGQKNNHSEIDCNITREKKQMVFGILPQGEENAVSSLKNNG